MNQSVPVRPPLRFGNDQREGEFLMKFLVVYATTEGQTKKIARFVASKLQDLGHKVSLQDSSGHLSGLNMAGFEGIILAGSVHEDQHPEVLGSFVAAHKSILETRRTLLLSVSLSAAFKDTLAKAEGYVKSFCESLDWYPDKYLLVAGAVRHAAYGYYQQMIVEHKVLPKRAIENPEEDQEFTDWASLEKAIVDFAGT
jgi:menaquinone-dependent protoporphyrinogen oxidase